MFMTKVQGMLLGFGMMLFFKWQSGGKRRKCLRPFPGCASNHLFLTMTELVHKVETIALRNFLLPSKHQLSLLISVLYCSTELLW